MLCCTSALEKAATVAPPYTAKFKPLGGPDGANGGRGGDVVLVVDENIHTLLDFHFHPNAKATNGKQGAGSNREGANGEDLILKVPDGTVVLDTDGNVLADLVGVGSRYDAAQGGRGGLGNAALASKARKAPGFALLGEDGVERDLVLELKSVADVGLLGFPPPVSLRWFPSCRRLSRRSRTTRSRRWFPTSVLSRAATPRLPSPMSPD